VSAPRASVIMPVFDPGPFLAQALASVAAQTFRDWELVIVDDGSTDPATVARLDEAARRPGITLVRTENRGTAAARNTAVEHARGEVIVPLDADDHLAPTFLERTVPILEAEPAVGVVHTWIGLVGGHHGVWRTGAFTLRELLARCTIHVTSPFRRHVWEDVGGWDSRFHESSEDWDFWLGAAARGVTARCVPEVLAYYRRSPTSRERRARAPEVADKLMRDLVRKHRALYEAHLEDAIVDLVRERQTTSLTLERIYDHPAVRTLLRLRGLVGARSAS
jgi:glycosyltransferase involved in cell wall biosynthesis